MIRRPVSAIAPVDEQEVNAILKTYSSSPSFYLSLSLYLSLKYNGKFASLLARGTSIFLSFYMSGSRKAVTAARWVLAGDKSDDRETEL